MNANDPTATSCCVCCKEIPLDAAFTPEGVEYVEHFCGLECYQRFQARAKAENETGADPNTCGSLPSDSGIPYPDVRKSHPISSE
nr:DUF3330 domain-containing protein [Ralstonia sp. 3PA37C10]